MSLSPANITFVNEKEAKAYECGICSKILTKPVAICDEHLFCQECVSQLIQREGNYFKCPNCRKVCDVYKIKRTEFIDRRLNELIVKCPNHEITQQKALYLRSLTNIRRTRSNYNNSSRRVRSRSRSRDRESMDTTNSSVVNKKVDSIESSIQLCKWTGPYSKLETHINECKLHIIRCQYCPVFMMRKDKIFHESICPGCPIQCQMCGTSVPRMKINEHLLHYCQSWIVDCNYCHNKMKRCEIVNHRNNECSETLMKCKYSSHGCDVILQRKDEKRHMRDGMKQHLMLMSESHDRMKNNVEQLQSSVDNLEGIIIVMKNEYGKRFDSLEERRAVLLDCVMNPVHSH